MLNGAQGLFNLATVRYLGYAFLTLLIPIILVENIMEMVHNKNDGFSQTPAMAKGLKEICLFTSPWPAGGVKFNG